MWIVMSRLLEHWTTTLKGSTSPFATGVLAVVVVVAGVVLVVGFAGGAVHVIDALACFPGHDEAYRALAEHLSARRDYATHVAIAEAALQAAPPDEHDTGSQSAGTAAGVHPASLVWAWTHW